MYVVKVLTLDQEIDCRAFGGLGDATARFNDQCRGAEVHEVELHELPGVGEARVACALVREGSSVPLRKLDVVKRALEERIRKEAKEEERRRWWKKYAGIDPPW